MKAVLVKTSGEVTAIELPREGAHTTINELVGGWFDCVNDYEMGVTAYVHDEGLLIDLPTNNIMSLLFRRVLAGDAVLVGVADDEGYDTDVASDFMTEHFANMALEASHDLELGLALNNHRESMDFTPVVTEWKD
jgi:hypothetical protein